MTSPIFTRKHLLLLVMLGLIALPAAHFGWGWISNRRLEKAISRLKAAGEPVTPDDLHLDDDPAATNASLDYKAAVKTVNTNTPAWKIWDKSDSDQFVWPYTPAEIATVRAIAAENTTALSTVESARGKKPGGWNDPYSSTNLLPGPEMGLNGARTLANLNMLASKAAHCDGDDKLAIERVCDNLAVAVAGEKRPTLVAHLVALGMTSMSVDTASMLAPGLHVGPGGASRDRINDLIRQLLDERPIDDGVKLSWRTERITEIGMMRGVIAGSLPMPGTVQTPQGGGANATGYLMKPLILADCARLADHFQGVMAASTAPDWPTAKRNMPDALPNQIRAHPVLHLLVSIMLPSLNQAAQLDYRCRADCRLAAVALAARLYEIDHDGNVPAALSDLVPAYLSAVPTDPLSGQPLLYRTDNPRVYSVGDDGVDHGGIPADPRGLLGPRRTTGDIVVYLHDQPRKPAATPTTMP